MSLPSPAELIAFPHTSAPPPPTLERLLSGLAEPASFAPRAVSLDTLEELHTLMALGPAMAEASPARVLFLSSEAAKARLAHSLAPADRDAARLAPACAIVAYDRQFAEQLIDFLPGRRPDGSCFDRPGAAAAAARRNGVLQGAYLAVAARALGLEAAFVRNFDRAGVAADFFRRQGAQPLFVARLGYSAG